VTVVDRTSFDEGGKVIGFEILDATDRYSEADIFNLATENLTLGHRPG